MPQVRLRDYKDPLSSYEHNVVLNLGIHNPGRYAGFDDLIQPSAGLTFNIRHVSTHNPKKPDGSSYGSLGVAISNQGVVVVENSQIGPFTADTNLGNTSVRYDLLVMEHIYTSIEGGQAATYKLIKGPLGSSLFPVMDNPSHQIAIGFLKIPAGASNLDNATWNKAKSPDSGDYVDAALYEINKFTRTQNFNQAELDSIDFPSAGLVSLKADGNLFSLEPSTPTEINAIKFEDLDVQNGLEVSFLFNSNVKLKTVQNLLPQDIANGYKRIIVPPGLSTGSNTFGTPPSQVTFYEFTLATNEVGYARMLLINNDYFITQLINTSKPPVSDVRTGTITFWFGDINANFEATGVGKGDMLGYFVLNGATYTLPNGSNVTVPDWRGRVPMGATNMPSTGAPGLDLDVLPNVSVNGTLGNKTHTLSVTELPSHSHGVTDPGHDHIFRFSPDKGGNSYGNVWMKLDANNASKRTDKSYTNISINSEGGNQPHNIIQPSIGTLAIVKLY